MWRGISPQWLALQVQLVCKIHSDSCGNCRDDVLAATGKLDRNGHFQTVALCYQ